MAHPETSPTGDGQTHAAAATTDADRPGDSEASADFGFRRVPAGAKAGLVAEVFDSVAGKYDLMNDVMSGGVHRLWKGELIDRVNPRPGDLLLDVAGGTGDIALRFLDRIDENAARHQAPAPPAEAAIKPAPGPGKGRAIVCDINRSMLSVGRDRAVDRGRLGGIDFVVGDAEKLPIATGSVDACTIAFGLRNVTRIDAALAEMRRVLRPGGRFFCLEFSHVVVPALAWLYDRYSFAVLPSLGQAIAGDRAAYQYLVESIRRFPPQDKLAQRMRAAGFEHVRYRNLTGGIAALHSGWRL